MKRNTVLLLAGLHVALLGAWPGGQAFAASPCKFSAGSTTLGAAGNTAALMANGEVAVTTPAVYKTAYTISVGLWVDADLASLGSDIPALALAYYEHANCIFALGRNAATNAGIHEMSLRIAGNRIRYFQPTSPKIAGTNAYWVQRTHQDWAKAIGALGPAAPKVNLLFSASSFVEIGSLGANGKVASWSGIGGASNGVGQGQALAQVDPAAYKNGAKPFNEDWWGVIAAHELGHALGFGGHLAQKFDNMCCQAPVGYTSEPGTTESYRYSMSSGPWNATVANNASSADNYADPYVSKPNPVTNQLWSFPQIRNFLIPYNFQDAIIWRHTGAACTSNSCPGWQALDQNKKAVAITTSAGRLYQLHGTGAIWRYTGVPCSGIRCPGWQKLDQNPRTKVIVAAGGSLYQLHNSGAIWRYTGTPCSGNACPGWQKLDQNARTVAIAAAGSALYQLHNTGAIWRYTGTPCTSAGCRGWQKLDQNANTKSIAAAGNALYQVHGTGAIWRYTGTPCNAAGCRGWQRLDQNARTVAIAAGGNALYQLHSTGAIWRYTGTPCNSAGCRGWQKLDQNTRTVAIAAGANALYQLHNTGAIWRYTGTPCSGTSCRGWQMLDNNARTKAIIAGSELYQRHSN